MLDEAFPARLEALHPLQERIQNYLKAQDCSESTLHAVELVCEELLVNSVTHGQARAIELRLEKRGDEIAIGWSDDGKEFDPNHPPARTSPVGGHGLTLIRKYFPILDYKRENERNHLRLGPSTIG